MALHILINPAWRMIGGVHQMVRRVEAALHARSQLTASNGEFVRPQAVGKKA